jgi:hypothetical protein
MKELEIRYDGVRYGVFEGSVLLRRFSTAHGAFQAFPAARYVLTDYLSTLHLDLPYAPYFADVIERDISNN